VSVTFSLDNHNRFWLHYRAHNDDSSLPTVVNLTNHTYFNLAGEASGDAGRQVIRINADNFTPTDSTLIPTGQIVPVAGTPFDFTRPKPIRPSITDCTAGVNTLGCQQLLTAHGFDHNWVLNPQTRKTTGPGGLNLAATARDPRSGRELTVWTDEPGVQFYTSNFLNGTLVGISGHIYRQTQAYTFHDDHLRLLLVTPRGSLTPPVRHSHDAAGGRGGVARPRKAWPPRVAPRAAAVFSRTTPASWSRCATG
jgi:aldose 1-epimerase